MNIDLLRKYYNVLKTSLICVVWVCSIVIHANFDNSCFNVLQMFPVTRSIATTSNRRRHWYRYRLLSTWRCRISSSSSCVVNSRYTTPWTWSRDRPSLNQHPLASPRPRSCSHTPDVRILSPACSRQQQQRPVQPSECYFLPLSLLPSLSLSFTPSGTENRV